VLPVSPGFSHATFAASEVSLHYVEGPRNGPDLVLLHGVARDWHSFAVLLPELAARFHLFAVDLRGHGASGRTPGAYRISQFAGDVIAFLQQITPRGAAVFGHSLGAMVGMFAAAFHECKMTALIVGDSMISPENLSNSLYSSFFSQLRELILRGGSVEDLARGIGKIRIQLPGLDDLLLLEELAGNTPRLLHDWARSAICTDPEVLAMALDATAFEGWEPRSVLPRIECPVLLLQGNPELDALLTDSDVKLATSLLPRSEHIKFPLLGHALFMQQPRPVLKEIDWFLSLYAH
jgi:pimeloyl-ACP methyl ester carboxylesterase